MTSSGPSWLVEPETREDGEFGTLIDPDGNYVQIIAHNQTRQQPASSEANRPRSMASATPYSGFSVDDLDLARAFYAEVLGLEVTPDPAGLRLQLDRDTSVLVYPSENHVPGSFTVLNLPVTDIDACIRTLDSRGVDFLRYDGLRQDGLGVHRGLDDGTGPNIAWFTDPAGNIMSLLCEEKA